MTSELQQKAEDLRMNHHIGYRIVKGTLGQVIDEYRFSDWPALTPSELHAKISVALRLLSDDRSCRVIPIFRSRALMQEPRTDFVYTSSL